MKSILITSIAYLPNIGGVETHLKDLVSELLNKKWQVTVLTYQPLQTPVYGQWIEKSKNLIIFRLPVIRGWFYKLVDKPILEFLFLAPLQFIVLPLLLIGNKNIKVINAQGLVAGFSAAFWSAIFKKRYVIALQNIYHFPKSSFYTSFARWIIGQADVVLTQSFHSTDEVVSLGISRNKIIEFTHWEDTDKLKPINKTIAKKKIGFSSEFIVSFFGRLVDVKGVDELLKSLKFINPSVKVLLYGEGPLIKEVKRFEEKYSNLKYMGIISPDLLPLHYSAADLVIMPSTHEEGFGRVAVGALLCSTPVVASNRGALPEIVNDKVGKLIEVSPENIAKEVNYLYTNRAILKSKSLNCRSYALKKFSSSNAVKIINTFA